MIRDNSRNVKKKATKLLTPTESLERASAERTPAKTKSIFGVIVKTVFVIALILGLAILVFKAGMGVYKEFADMVRPKNPTPVYIYQDNWVYDQTLTVHFVSEYKDIIHFSSDFPFRLSFKGATCSYCVRNYVTKFEACGNAEEDVTVPNTKGDKVSLLFKSRDGQEKGQINVIVEKNMKRKVRIK